jgi:hypothetical protein
MKTKLDKRITAGLLAGAVMAGGLFGTYQAQASAAAKTAAVQEMKQAKHQEYPPQFDAEKAAEDISSMFGVDKAQVASALQEKKDLHDIGHAAMLAKVSGKSFSDILAMKTDQNKWQEVEKTLGVTKDQIAAEKEDMMSTALEQRAGVDKTKAAALLKAGYHPEDIAMAGVLAKESSKDIDAVLAMKKVNNSWRDVAESLGVSQETLQNDMKTAGGGQFDKSHHAGMAPEGQPAPETAGQAPDAPTAAGE